MSSAILFVMWRTARIGAFTLGLVMLGHAGVAAEADDQSRGIRIDMVRPLPQAQTRGNAALFVGIRQFDTNSGLSGLRFTTDDAVGMAELLVLQLQLIPTNRARLALSGEPFSEKGKQRLGRLRAAGVPTIPADRRTLLDAVDEITRLPAQPEDLVLISFFSHGYERDGACFIMPTDGRYRFIKDTGVSLVTVQEALRGSVANKRVLLVDACREMVDGQTRGDLKMSDTLAAALAKAEGMAVIASCSAGELAWEAPEFGHGVFAHFFIEALRGKATKGLDDRLVTLGDASAYATREVSKWVRENKKMRQEPRFDGELARNIPMGLFHSTDAAAVRKRKQDALAFLEQARKDQPELVSGVLRGQVEDFVMALDGGRDLDEWVEQLELLKGSRAAAIRNFVSWVGGALPGSKSALPKVEASTTKETSVPVVSSPVSVPEPVLRFPQQGQAWTNTLGMRFLPVAGLEALVSVWETRVQDYRVFFEQTKASNEIQWNEPGFQQGPDHPAVQVNWLDAHKFCDWLTARERQEGRLNTNQCYRLPTDLEWSKAAGIETEFGKTPGERHNRLRGLYAWGTTWPPPASAGNFYGQESSQIGIRTFRDGFTNTAPVGSFPASTNRLHDLAGNVWEWCEDLFSAGDADRVTRGGSWRTDLPEELLLTHRMKFGRHQRLNDVGFRCVLETPRNAPGKPD